MKKATWQESLKWTTSSEIRPQAIWVKCVVIRTRCCFLLLYFCARNCSMPCGRLHLLALWHIWVQVINMCQNDTLLVMAIIASMSSCKCHQCVIKVQHGLPGNAARPPGLCSKELRNILVKKKRKQCDTVTCDYEGQKKLSEVTIFM